MAFEVATRRYVVGAREELGITRAQDLFDLGARPHIELAFLAFGVGVEGSRERAVRRRHLAGEPADGFVGALAIEIVAGAQMREREQLEKLGVVVEHLLEMRHQPALVDRVAREAAAEMVVDAALAHMGEGELDELEEARLVAPLPGAPQKLEHRALRKFRRAAEPTIDVIEGATDRGRGGVELVRADHHLAGGPRLRGERLHQRIAIVRDALRLVAEEPRDLLHDVDEPRPAVARDLRKIRAAPHRLAVGREKHGERPAALLAERMKCRHVDLIDVRPLLAIDLDVDEEVVHHRRDRRVLEAFMRHHVAPVARGVADREQDRLVARLRGGERLRSPRPPLDGIMAVLQEIGARLVGEAIFVRRRCRTCEAMSSLRSWVVQNSNCA